MNLVILASSAALRLHGFKGPASLIDRVVALIIPDHMVVHVHVCGIEVDGD